MTEFLFAAAPYVETFLYIVGWVLVSYLFCRGVDACIRSISKDES